MFRVRFRLRLRLGFCLTLTWMVSLSPAEFRAAADDLGPPPLFIEGYTGQVSYQAGDDVTFHISTSAASYALEIARLGAKRDVVLTTNGLRGTTYPIPEDACSHGCAWPGAFRVTVPPEWSSGYYQVLLRVSDNGGKFVQRNRRTAESECFFVLRPRQPGQRARILLELSCNTYNKSRAMCSIVCPVFKFALGHLTLHSAARAKGRVRSAERTEVHLK